MADFVGTWERVRTENFDAYMDSLGIPEDFKKIARENKETIIMANEGDKWENQYITGSLEEIATFTVGEPTEYKTVLGKMCTGTIKSVGEKMIETHVMEDGMTMDLEKTIENGQLVVKTTTKGVSVTAWYDRK